MTHLISEKNLEDLKVFFARDVAQRATKPIREGAEIAIYIDDAGPVSLSKNAGRMGIFPIPPTAPDLSFWVTSMGLEELTSNKTEDIGEIGIAIIKLMVHEKPEFRMKAKVHIGGFDLFRNGYLSVLPLGGATVMKFLASKGLTGISKIKDAISNLRG